MEWMTTPREESGLLCSCFVSLSGPIIIIIIIVIVIVIASQLGINYCYRLEHV